MCGPTHFGGLDELQAKVYKGQGVHDVQHVLGAHMTPAMYLGRRRQAGGLAQAIPATLRIRLPALFRAYPAVARRTPFVPFPSAASLAAQLAAELTAQVLRQREPPKSVHTGKLAKYSSRLYRVESIEL